MATLAEAQEEANRQITRRLEAENDLNEMEQRWRAQTRENGLLKQQVTELTDRIEKAEGELADLSTSLLEQANLQVFEANKKAAAALQQAEESRLVVESQDAQLKALKTMLMEFELQQHEDQNRKTATPSSRNGFNVAGGPSSLRRQTVREMARNGRPSDDLVLDLDSYLSPFRPLMRTDLKDFQDFVAVWGCDPDIGTVQPGRWKMDSPAWRKPRFVQRCIVEDIEPTLRLDRSPHLSWLACRSFLAGVLDQTIALEPVSTREASWASRPSQPCILCGENRSDPVYARSYWARFSQDAEPIVLDLTCVTKARLACELVAFIRNIASRKPADHAAHVGAWLLCNGLREQLFWVRTGGFFSESEDTVTRLLNMLEIETGEDVPPVPVPTTPVPTTPLPATPQTENLAFMGARKRTVYEEIQAREQRLDEYNEEESAQYQFIQRARSADDVEKRLHALNAARAETETENEDEDEIDEKYV